MAGFYEKPAIFVSLRGRSAAVAIFKPKAWHPVAKHESTKQEEIPITKNERYAASSRPAIFRYGTTKRIVKDCRVGRTRPPRNDKTGRFCIRRKKRLTFGGENGRPREPLNKSAAALSGSFVPTDRFENLEIHKVFLQFPNLNLETKSLADRSCNYYQRFLLNSYYRRKMRRC